MEPSFPDAKSDTNNERDEFEETADSVEFEDAAMETVEFASAEALAAAIKANKPVNEPAGGDGQTGTKAIFPNNDHDVWGVQDEGQDWATETVEIKDLWPGTAASVGPRGGLPAEVDIQPEQPAVGELGASAPAVEAEAPAPAVSDLWSGFPSVAEPVAVGPDDDFLAPAEQVAVGPDDDFLAPAAPVVVDIDDDLLAPAAPVVVDIDDDLLAAAAGVAPRRNRAGVVVGLDDDLLAPAEQVAVDPDDDLLAPTAGVAPRRNRAGVVVGLDDDLLAPAEQVAVDPDDDLLAPAAGAAPRRNRAEVVVGPDDDILASAERVAVGPLLTPAKPIAVGLDDDILAPAAPIVVDLDDDLSTPVGSVTGLDDLSSPAGPGVAEGLDSGAEAAPAGLGDAWAGDVPTGESLTDDLAASEVVPDTDTDQGSDDPWPDESGDRLMADKDDIWVDDDPMASAAEDDSGVGDAPVASSVEGDSWVADQPLVTSDPEDSYVGDSGAEAGAETDGEPWDTDAGNVLVSEAGDHYEWSDELAEDATGFPEVAVPTAQPEVRPPPPAPKSMGGQAATWLGLTAILFLFVGTTGFGFSRWLDYCQADLAQLTAVEVASLQARARSIHMESRHDVTPDLQEIRTRRITLGEHFDPLGQSSELLALARGRLCLSLRDYKQALVDLAQAGNSEPAANLALGQAQFALYRQNLQSVQGIRLANEREMQADRIRTEYLEPARRSFELYQSDPGQDMAQARYTKAEIHFAKDEYEEALREAQSAIARDRHLWEAHVLAAEIHLSLGRREHNAGRTRDASGLSPSVEQQYDLAIEQYQEASRLGRSDSRIYRGLCAVWNNRLEAALVSQQPSPGPLASEAAAACQAAIETNPDDIVAHLEQIRLYRLWDRRFLDDDDPRPTLEQLDKSAERLRDQQPGNESGHLAKGHFHELTGAFEMASLRTPHPAFNEAVEQYLDAVEVNSGSFWAHNALTHVYSDLAAYQLGIGEDPREWTTKAETHCARSTQIDDTLFSYLSYYYVGLAWASSSEYEMANGEDPIQSLTKAMEHLERGMERNPSFAPFAPKYAQLESQLARYEEGL